MRNTKLIARDEREEVQARKELYNNFKVDVFMLRVGEFTGTYLRDGWIEESS